VPTGPVDGESVNVVGGVVGTVVGVADGPIVAVGVNTVVALADGTADAVAVVSKGEITPRDAVDPDAPPAA